MQPLSNAVVWASTALLVVACSSDDSSSSSSSGGPEQTQVEAQMPAGGNASGAGNGNNAGAGDTSESNAGMASPATPAAGGSTPSGAASSGTPEGQSEGTELQGAAGQSGSPGAGADTGGEADDPGNAAPDPEDPTMSFFVTSRGSGTGGDFGGIAGADAFCTQLATEASAELGQKTWHAYLSTANQDARDRIGTGPWRNAAGVIIANTVEQLHDQGPTGEGGSLDQTWPLNDPSIALDERGNQVQGANGTVHDILTGSNVDGTLSASGTCSDWSSQTGTTRNGHSDRVRFQQNIPSWNSSHDTGCGEPAAGSNFQQGTVSQGGGRGSIYCFAID